MNGAVISTRCLNTMQPSIITTSTQSIQFGDPEEANVTLDLFNVPDCHNNPITTPCVDTSPVVPRPPLFYCVFIGSSGEAVVGPVRAQSALGTTINGEVYGSVYMVCPLPQVSAIGAAGYDSDPYGTAKLNITARHMAPEGPRAVDVPFEGVPGGNALVLTNLPAPPSPSTPPVPPRPPPPPVSPAPGSPSISLTIKMWGAAGFTPDTSWSGWCTRGGGAGGFVQSSLLVPRDTTLGVIVGQRNSNQPLGATSVAGGGGMSAVMIGTGSVT